MTSCFVLNGDMYGYNAEIHKSFSAGPKLFLMARL